MKLALVGPTFPYRGGISQYTTSLYHALCEHHEVLLVSFSRQYPSFLFPGTSQRDNSLEPFRAPAEFLLDSVNPISWKQTARRILTFDPDVVVFQWWQPFFSLAYGNVAGQLKSLSSRPVSILYLCHNVRAHERFSIPLASTLQDRLIRFAFRHVDAFLVHAGELDQVVRQFREDARVGHIFHPLYEFFARPPGASPRVKGDRKRILFFGKIRPYKGLEVLIEALPLLDEKLDLELVVAGEFYIDPRPLKEHVRASGTGVKVTWIDHYIENERVSELFESTDLVVLPYRSATQSGVVPVAYQFDVPVIASNVGGLSEVIEEGRTGYLFPAGDSAALAERINRFFKEDDPEFFRTEIRKFKSRLSWAQVVERIQELGCR